uniref:Clathrin light chain n=1 Tax=Rhabditophanes sp. KR3021 TaxID=114890 RepID=A0AC35U2N2_9BILA
MNNSDSGYSGTLFSDESYSANNEIINYGNNSTFNSGYVPSFNGDVSIPPISNVKTQMELSIEKWKKRHEARKQIEEQVAATHANEEAGRFKQNYQELLAHLAKCPKEKRFVNQEDLDEYPDQGSNEDKVNHSEKVDNFVQQKSLDIRSNFGQISSASIPSNNYLSTQFPISPILTTPMPIYNNAFQNESANNKILNNGLVSNFANNEVYQNGFDKSSSINSNNTGSSNNMYHFAQPSNIQNFLQPTIPTYLPAQHLSFACDYNPYYQFNNQPYFNSATSASYYSGQNNLNIDSHKFSNTNYQQ